MWWPFITLIMSLAAHLDAEDFIDQFFEDYPDGGVIRVRHTHIRLRDMFTHTRGICVHQFMIPCATRPLQAIIHCGESVLYFFVPTANGKFWVGFAGPCSASC